jgi:YidC/Oxa1 family membrane protein insertase
MQMDRNTIIGFVLLAGLFFGYFWFTRQGQLEAEKNQKHIRDSIAAIQPKFDTTLARMDSAKRDSAMQATAAGGFKAASQVAEELTVVENEVMKISFTNRGGQPKQVELKKYKSLDSQNVKLVEGDFDKITYPINTGTNRLAQISSLMFGQAKLAKNADGSQTISYQLSDSTGMAVVHQYVIRPSDYLIDWNLQMTGVDRLLTQNSLNLTWQVEAKQHEHDIKGEKRETQIGFWEGNDYDYFTLLRTQNHNFEKAVQWVSIKQKFFNTTLIAKNNFNSGDISCTIPGDSSGVVTSAITNLKMVLPTGTVANIPFQIYYGPNDFSILKSYNNGMQNVINLGQGMYAFVKYINRFIIIPVFDLIKRSGVGFGLAIALLTIVIRLFTSPLVYTSYLSGAKMKALRPELDVLKAKYKDDQQAFSMEQMKLFRSAGVNPLGGCIPALLQIPIFFSLYSFFNANIDLRGQSFWWAKDLSTYDSILDFGHIPLISSVYGTHISLFTLLAVATSLLISIYSMSMTPDQNNPMLKYMPYIFPFFLLGIFNGLPAALTWYYTVSNLITLLLQYVIQHYIIDHDKILAQLEENKKKPKSKSKWQERLEQMQESQKKVQDLKGKSPKK